MQKDLQSSQLSLGDEQKQKCQDFKQKEIDVGLQKYIKKFEKQFSQADVMNDLRNFTQQINKLFYTEYLQQIPRSEILKQQIKLEIGILGEIYLINFKILELYNKLPELDPKKLNDIVRWINKLTSLEKCKFKVRIKSLFTFLYIIAKYQLQNEYVVIIPDGNREAKNYGFQYIQEAISLRMLDQSLYDENPIPQEQEKQIAFAIQDAYLKEKELQKK